ncbi:unnamed protein product [Brassicogethes aeneus]|uniref:Peptidase S1 domain-containing protein n=1 Tax=Brassicogethes aeneus TaxID=1431903 RepID=A0A9P0B1N9_BRAAE|nr:unnamed protein product [Brassicogethes aeneus]
MRVFYLSYIFLQLSIEILGQITDTFTCVPNAQCPGGGGGGGDINPRVGPDLRIVSPTGATTTAAPTSTCPPGYVACTTLPKCGTPSVQPSTANGQATRGSLPWQAYLTNSAGTYIGGGMLLDSYHVLTAAHKTNESGIIVYMGVYNPQTDLSGNTMRSNVQSVSRYPSYNISTLRDDIAILRLSTPLTMSATAIAGCLPAAGRSFVGNDCIVAGWGQTNFNTYDAPTSILKQAIVRIIDAQTCLNSYSNANLLGTNAALYLDTQREICAGGSINIDACTKDGGSPLMCNDGTKYVAAGLVIWGKNCGMQNVYGVYVSVPSYRSWIDCVVRAFNSNQVPVCY